MTTRTTTGLIWVTTLLAAFTTTGCADSQHLSYVDMLDHMTNLERLPAIEPGVSCGQFSSYDRRSRYDAAIDEYIQWNANGDAGNFLSVDPNTGEAVMADMTGPGCVFRIWSANPQGVIRFYLDGDTEPTFEHDFHELCTGKIDPFVEPLVWKRDKTKVNSASNIYLPISYNKSCKITSIVYNDDGTTSQPRHYYIVNYRTFPSCNTVETLTFPVSETNRKAICKTAAQWGKGFDAPMNRTEINIEPGQTTEIYDDQGPQVITALSTKIASNNEPWATRKVMLRAYWDGEATPSINCPIGDFFGEPKDANYRSYPMVIADDINSCFFPMPFRKSARIELTNEGDKVVTVRYGVESRSCDIPDNWGYFRAKYRSELASTMFDYPLIEATGAGKLVGICLFPDNIHGGWWGEGDEKVYVDGEKFPSWFGTGSEDYFGDAWGIKHFEQPSHGHPQKKVERMQGCYRWHLGDNIPFYKSFKMTIENYTGEPQLLIRNDYYSVAYWYQMHGGTDFFTDTPVEDRIPAGYVAPGALEIEQHQGPAINREGISIVTDDGLPQELSRRRGVKLTGKVGDTRQLSLPIPKKERYIVTFHNARETQTSTYTVLYKDKPIDGPVELTEGVNHFDIRFTGEPIEGDTCGAIIDYATLEVHRNMVTEWMTIMPFPNIDEKGLNTVYAPEKEIDLTKTYKGRDGTDIAWKKVSNPEGKLMFGNQFTPNENFIMYGTCIVNSPRDKTDTLLLGSDDSVKVWLNGKLVHTAKGARSMIVDHDSVDVELKKGENILLFKVEQKQGDTGFAARFYDAKDELTFSLPE